MTTHLSPCTFFRNGVDEKEFRNEMKVTIRTIRSLMTRKLSSWNPSTTILLLEMGISSHTVQLNSNPIPSKHLHSIPSTRSVDHILNNRSDHSLDPSGKQECANQRSGHRKNHLWVRFPATHPKPTINLNPSGLSRRRPSPSHPLPRPNPYPP
jgi:hypothetical protein